MTDVERRGERPWNADIDRMSGIVSATLHTLIQTRWDEARPRDGHRHWLIADHRALDAALHLEGYIAMKGLPPEAPPDVRMELNRCLGSWHAALPFSEAERRLILDVHRSPEREAIEPGPDNVRATAKLVRKTELELIDGGVRRLVKGRDLMRRWWLWRRDMDEFAGQGGLDQARTALAALADRLISPDKMPEIFYELQGKERPVPYRDSFRSTA